MTRYALRGLRTQWRSWTGTLVVLALAAGLTYVCLIHRYTVTRPEVTSRARALGVGPAELEMSGTSVYVYSALVTIPVVAIVGRSCVQALRTTWAQWRLAGATPRQVRSTVIATVAVVGVIACIPGLVIGVLAAQPVSGVLTRMAAQRMGTISIEHNPLVMLAAVASVVLIALLGAVGPSFHAARVPAVAALKDTPALRSRFGVLRWIIAIGWLGVCALQLVIAVAVTPIPSPTGGLPAGGAQMMTLALLLAVWTVIIAPLIVPAVMRIWTAPVAVTGAVAMLARRSALWRGELASGAVALLALGLTFTTAMLSAVQTNAATARAAGITGGINQVDSYVLAAVLAVLSTSGAVAIISMTSRAREREFATLRCGGVTPAQTLRQAWVEPLLYVGTALLLAVVPTLLTALGEAWFLTRAGLPFRPVPAWWQAILLAGTGYVILAVTMQASARRAVSTPMNVALSPE